MSQPDVDTRPYNLHLGCGLNHLDGWLNCDQFPTEATDRVFDLEYPWPLDDNTACQIYSSHVVEHLEDWQTFFREAWRVLQPGGRLQIRVPYGGHPSAWWDFGHRRPWFPENWVFFQPGYARQIGNLEHDGWQWPFAIEVIQVRLSGQVVQVLRWLPRWARQWLLQWVRHSADACQELFVALRPLKSKDEVQQWRALNHPTGYRLEYICFAHQWQGRALQPGELATPHTLAAGISVGCYV